MRIAIIPGDGIGKDVTAEAVKALNAVGETFGRQFGLEHLPWGADYFLQTGISVPPNGFAMLRDEFDAVFIGALGDPRIPDMRHGREILLAMRFELDLYINLRPVKLLPGAPTPLAGKGPNDIDMIVVRENTEGAYVGEGGLLRPGTPHEVASQGSLNTWTGVERCVRYAFDVASTRKRRHVTLSHKTNVLTYSGELWMRAGRAVAAEVGTVGTVLVDGASGLTLYIFTKDVKDSGESVCTGECLVTWPALTVAAGETPTGGEGVTGALGTITRTDDNTLQVTYNGLPLYFFQGDTAAGQANGVYEFWEVVAALPRGSDEPRPS